MDFRFNEKVIFEKTSVEFFKDKVNVLLGPNGSGKSTLLKILTGEIKNSCKVENLSKNLFYLPQNPYYPKGITTFDYLSSVFFKNNLKWFLNMEEKQKILNILETINLSDKKDIYIENLSAGELQKVNIGLGLLSDADTFLLDEPASNMDLINQIKILKMLNAISKKGKTSIIIMHDLNLAAKYGDCFAGINQNYKIIQKNRNQFFEENNLRDIFNIDFKIIHEGESLYVQVID